MLHRLFKRLPSAQSLKDNRFLKPFARYLHHYFLWQFNRRAVAGGVAVGLFLGILVPFMQIFLAAFAAILLRVNLPVAAASTLVTNPLTFPAIYYIAYRLGEFLTGGKQITPEAAIVAEIEQAVTVSQSEATGWMTNLVDWAQSVGLPLAVGLLVLATVAAIGGYFVVSVVWQLRVRRNWRRRQKRVNSGDVPE